jgi:hypothetical protein
MFEHNKGFKKAGSYFRISNTKNDESHTLDVRESQVVACLQILVYCCERVAKIEGIFGQVIFVFNEI